MIACQSCVAGPSVFFTSLRYRLLCTLLCLRSVSLDLQKKFRGPLRGQSPERITVARHQGHNLLTFPICDVSEY